MWKQLPLLRSAYYTSIIIIMSIVLSLWQSVTSRLCTKVKVTIAPHPQLMVEKIVVNDNEYSRLQIKEAFKGNNALTEPQHTLYGVNHYTKCRLLAPVTFLESNGDQILALPINSIVSYAGNIQLARSFHFYIQGPNEYDSNLRCTNRRIGVIFSELFGASLSTAAFQVADNYEQSQYDVETACMSGFLRKFNFPGF